MKYEYKTIEDIGDIFDKRVLLRLDLNVPVKDGVVVDDFRIKQSLKTLEFLKEKGARLIIVSHIEGEVKTLKPVFEHLNTMFPLKAFVTKFDGSAEIPEIESLHAREAVLCENLRQYEGEKVNDETFAHDLAKRADLYVNEAFSVSHRAHASIVGVTQFLPSYAGFLFHQEVTRLSEAFSPLRPALFVLGGAKFDTKLPLLEKFMRFYDYVFVGGALANDVFKFKGLEVGKSRVSEGNVLTKDFIAKENLFTPVDVVVDGPQGVKVKKPNEVEKDEIIMDAGPGTSEQLNEYIRRSKFILWNGPLGNYEKGFKKPTEDLASYIASNSIRSIIGGGDTLAAVASQNLLDKFDFVSTAGGAMLDFLANDTLPGVEALSMGMKKF
jgi:phosphoglycerate kinase